MKNWSTQNYRSESKLGAGMKYISESYVVRFWSGCNCLNALVTFIEQCSTKSRVTISLLKLKMANCLVTTHDNSWKDLLMQDQRLLIVLRMIQR